MKQSRRLKRMSQKGRGVSPTGGLSLVSLMDVFTILVFFLLVNSASSDVMEPPKNIKLPDSIVESKPRETVLVMITPEKVLVQGKFVITTQEVIDSEDNTVEAIVDELNILKEKVVGFRTKIVAESKEVTVLAHRTVPFHLIKKVMATCTSAGYGKISLAVIQKAVKKG